MTGSLMAASQPVAKLGVPDHQAETADSEEEIDDIEHALCSIRFDRPAEHGAKRIKSRLGNRDEGIKRS
jgi:hypothetical protein